MFRGGAPVFFKDRGSFGSDGVDKKNAPAVNVERQG
jgi:hypothetical protein